MAASDSTALHTAKSDHHHHHHRHSTPFQHITNKVTSFLRWLPLLLWIIILVVMPTIQRGGELWWLPATGILILSSCALWLFCRFFLGENSRHSRIPMPRPFWDNSYFLFLLPIVVGLLQLIPCKWLVSIFSPNSSVLWEEANGTSHFTLYPEATKERLFLLFLCLLACFFIRNFCRHRRYAYGVLGAIAAAALLNALFAFWQLLSPKTAVTSPISALMTNSVGISGTFLNRNHFGFMMTAGICSICGLFMMISEEKMAPLNNVIGIVQREKRNRWCYFFCIVLFILYTANVISLSRGSFLASNLALAALVLYWMNSHHFHLPHQRHVAYAMILIFIVALIFALPYVLEKLSNRFDQLLKEDGITTDTRVYVWKTTLHLTGKYWLTGTGLGAYGDAIQASAPNELDAALIDHAHNDYLEFLAELGIPCSLLLLFLLFTLLKSVPSKLKNCRDYPLKRAGFAAFIALLAGAYHEFFDFNLQAYPNAIIYAALLGVVMAACAQEEDLVIHTKQRRSFAMYGCILMIILLFPAAHQLKKAWYAHRVWLAQDPAYHPQGQSSVQPSKRLAWAEQSWLLQKNSPRALTAYARELIDHANISNSPEEQWNSLEKAYHLQLEVLRCRPSSLEDWTLFGVLAFHCGNLDQSFKAFEQSIALAPSLTSPKLLASRYYQLGFNSRAYPLSMRQRWHDRAQELRKNVLHDRQELALNLLPELLLPETPISDFLSWCSPNQKLSFAVMELLLKQQRYVDAEIILNQFPPEPEITLDTLMRLATWRHLLANILHPENQQTTYLQWQATTAMAKKENYPRQPLAKESDWQTLDSIAGQLSDEIAGPLPSRRLEGAQAMLTIANPFAAIQILAPLLYPGHFSPSLGEVQKAQELLSTLALDVNTTEGYRLELIRQLLLAKEALQTHDVVIMNAVQKSLQELQRRYAIETDSTGYYKGGRINKFAWLQIHLLDYYLGLLYEAQNNLPMAIPCYQAILKKHPSNALALERLAAIAPETLSSTQLALGKESGKPPLGHFSSIADVISITPSATDLNALHESLSIDVLIRIHGTVSENISFKLVLSTSCGPFRTINLVPVESRYNSSLQWETGALLRFRAEIPTVQAQLVSAGHPAHEGLLTMEVIQSPRQQATPRVINASVRLH